MKGEMKGEEMEIRKLIRRTNMEHTRMGARYQRLRIREFCRVSLDQYLSDSTYWEAVADALRSGRALHGDDRLNGLAIVG